MVSLRRRKLIGISSGRNLLLASFPRFSDIAIASKAPLPRFTSVSVHQIHSVSNMKASAESDKSDSITSKEQYCHPFREEDASGKQQRRRESPDLCVMRGVYFKNMKWQAAIKVDKKQIHLGTVGSQEEAARLYDRAAFMCGREPNFELDEEEKLELKQFEWEEFLAVTRQAIANKKHKRRVGIEKKQRQQLTGGEW